MWRNIDGSQRHQFISQAVRNLLVGKAKRAGIYSFILFYALV
jgi:hypothetical protein